MSATGGDNGDEGTRVDRQPPVFPSVSDSGRSVTHSEASLFTSPEDRRASEIEAQPEPVKRPPRDSRWRWAVAGVATVLVLSMIGGVLLLAAPHAGSPSLLSHYVPADTAMYFEADLGLAGDQQANLAAFMSKFPGFADQAAFDQKLDETLEQLVSSAHVGLDWKADVEPWFGGQVASFGEAPVSISGTHEASPANSVMALTVKERTTLHDLIVAKLGASHATFEAEQYQGADIWKITPEGSTQPVNVALTGDAALVAPSLDRLRRALDVRADQTAALAGNAYFTQQLGQLHSDRLATVYYDSSRSTSALSPLPTAGLLPAECMAPLGVGGTIKYVGEARAESDRMTMTMRVQPPTSSDMPPLPANARTTLADSMPADAIAYAEMRNVGTNAGYAIKKLLKCLPGNAATGPLPSGLGDPSQFLGQALGTKPEDYFDFVESAAVAIRQADNKMQVGLVATVNDSAVAGNRVSQLVSLVRMFGTGLGGSQSGLSVETVDHNGVTIYVIHVPGTTGQPAGDMTLQIAVANDKLYAGVDDFVASALDRTAASGLSSSAAFQNAVGTADNAGVVYVDVPAFRALQETRMAPTDRPHYETDVKPFLEHMKTLTIIARNDGGTMVANGFLLVE